MKDCTLSSDPRIHLTESIGFFNCYWNQDAQSGYWFLKIVASVNNTNIPFVPQSQVFKQGDLAYLFPNTEKQLYYRVELAG